MFDYIPLRNTELPPHFKIVNGVLWLVGEKTEGFETSTPVATVTDPMLFDLFLRSVAQLSKVADTAHPYGTHPPV